VRTWRKDGKDVDEWNAEKRRVQQRRNNRRINKKWKESRIEKRSTVTAHSQYHPR
jgi:hypothetical protein